MSLVSICHPANKHVDYNRKTSEICLFTFSGLITKFTMHTPSYHCQVLNKVRYVVNLFFHIRSCFHLWKLEGKHNPWYMQTHRVKAKMKHKTCFTIYQKRILLKSDHKPLFHSYFVFAFEFAEYDHIFRQCSITITTWGVIWGVQISISNPVRGRKKSYLCDEPDLWFPLTYCDECDWDVSICKSICFICLLWGNGEIAHEMLEGTDGFVC